MATNLPDWEPIDPEYRKLRGFNYVAPYPSLVQNPPSGFDGFNGVGSSTVMWGLYEPQGETGFDVATQLDQLRRAGVNVLRVFMSFPAWEFDELDSQPGNAFLDRVQDFLGLCEERRIYCIPVLWDHTRATGAQDPVDASIVRNNRWHRNPGERRIRELLSTSREPPEQNLLGTPAEAYVRGLVRIALESPAFLAWDIINEPALPVELLIPFVSSTLEILHDEAPDHPTVLGLLWSDPRFHDLARDPRVDILDIHPYGITRAAIEATLWDASHIEDPKQPSGFVRKPVIATEIGSPGEGQAYQDAIRFARGVPRPELGQNMRGIGFMSFMSHIDRPGSPLPLQDRSGAFYADGEVRSIADVRAWVDAAIADGIDATGLYAEGELTEKAVGSIGFVSQSPVTENLDTYDELRELLWMPVASLGLLTWPQYIEAVSAFRSASFYLRVTELASSTNGNPWGAGGSRAGDAVSAEDRERFADFARRFVPDSAAFFEFANQIAALVTNANEPPPGGNSEVRFDPSEPAQVALLSIVALSTWREVIRRYTEAQGGPYEVTPPLTAARPGFGARPDSAGLGTGEQSHDRGSEGAESGAAAE